MVDSDIAVLEPTHRFFDFSTFVGTLLDLGLGAVDIVWPPQCVLCESPGDLFFCESCASHLTPVVTPYCVKCGRPGVRHWCPDCGETPWQGPQACAAMRQVAVYESTLAEVIKRYKFDGMRCLSLELGAILTRWLQNASHVWREVDYVVPVPETRLRRWELGYGHAELLATEVSKYLNAPLIQPLKRVRGRSQVGLKGAERRENAKRLYQIKQPSQSLSGKRILVVDDVVTTGATLQAVSTLLKSMGASKVRAIALARRL